MSRTLDHTHLLPLFHEAVRTAQGTNSALIMEHDVFVGRHGIKGQSWSKGQYGDDNAKDHSIWLRWNQPCQGGEMRKYASVHGDECTQPESHKPTDLHHPFPEGNPVAVGVKFGMAADPNAEQVLEFLYNDKSSPYRSGTGDTTFVRDEQNRIIGIILEDTKKIDPTVMVNLIQMVRSQVLSGAADIIKMVNEGATMQQAVALKFIKSQYSYYFATVVDVRRLLDSDPIDLSKGISFFDRGDYNRINVHDLFTHPDKKLGFIWARDIEGAGVKTTTGMVEVLMKKYEEQGGTKLLSKTIPVLDAVEPKPRLVRTTKAA